jgi:antitoxin component YwqK of YwqJK toxin-antitoxin module
MKFRLFFTLISCLSFFSQILAKNIDKLNRHSYSRDRIQKEIDSFKQSGMAEAKSYHKNGYLDSSIVLFYSSGKLKEIVFLRENRIIEKYEFYENEKIKSISYCFFDKIEDFISRKIDELLNKNRPALKSSYHDKIYISIWEDLIKLKQTYRQKSTFNPQFDSTYIEFNKDGNVKYICSFLNKKKHGCELYFYDKSIEETTFFHDIRLGEENVFDRNYKLLSAKYKSIDEYYSWNMYEKDNRNVITKIFKQNKDGNYDSIPNYETYINENKNERWVIYPNQSNYKDYSYYGETFVVFKNFKNNLADGQWVSYFDYDFRFNSGLKKEIITYKNGQRNGLRAEYFKNTKLRIKEYWKYDIRDSIYEEYNESGDLVKKCFYKNGILDGAYFGLDKGDLVKCFYKNGVLHGEYKKFDRNGKLVTSIGYKNGVYHGYYMDDDYVGNFNNGKRTGRFKWRETETENISTYRNDTLIEEKKYYIELLYNFNTKDYYFATNYNKPAYVYKLNNNIGAGTYYYKSGKIDKIRYWKNEKAHGNWLEYAQNDPDAREKYYYLNNKQIWLNGELKQEIVYESNGQIWVIYNYANGIKNGEKKEFENGKLIRKETYKDDILNGEYIDFWPNGKIKNVGNYQKGVKVGSWKIYNDLGRLEFETSY